MAGYKDLIIFQKADELAFQVYQLTSSFPQEEPYCLTSQIRRSALSVPANIVEGYARRSKKEFRHFISISLGSLAETKYFFDFSKRLGYHKQDHSKTKTLLEELGKTLWSFHQSL